VIFIADLPPPVHGMANVNAAFLEALDKKNSKKIFVIDSSPPIPVRFFGTKIWLLAKVLFMPVLLSKLLLTLLRLRKPVVYRAINGGMGQVFDLFFIGIGRLFSAQIFIHHHSFNYITRRSKLFSMLCFLAGGKAVHITLGSAMRDGLCNKYAISHSKVRVLSNLAFFDIREDIFKENNCLIKNHKIKIGHLANLCEEKGLDTFLEICVILKNTNFNYEAVLAGPFSNQDAKKVYEKNKEVVSYSGPLYDTSKDDFFKSLDVFVFPSKYEDEAEPLVLYEAAKHGVLLVGTKRGCMNDVMIKIKMINWY